MPTVHSATHEATARPGTARRPGSRAMGMIAFAVIALLSLIAVPAFGLAGNSRAGDSVDIKAGETIEGDLYATSGTFKLAGTVNGDANVASGESDITGTINGSLNLATGDASITGTVTGSVRVMAGMVTIRGRIDGDLVVAGGQVKLEGGGRVGGDVYLVSGQADLRGSIQGDINAKGGTLSIGGAVAGSIDASATTFTIADTARINGHVTYGSRNEADISQGAQISQGVSRKDLDPWGDGGPLLSRASAPLLQMLWIMVTGAVFIALAPRLANGIGANGQRLMRSLITGVIGLFVVPIILLILMVTVMGFPAGLIGFATWLSVLYLTQFFAGLTIGRVILPNKWNDGSRGYLLLATVLGVILLSITHFVPFPFVHAGFTVLVTIWGLGAAVSLVSPFGRDEVSSPTAVTRI